MANEPKQTVDIPELDSAQGTFQLELSTRKYMSGELVSSAHGQFARDGMITFMMYGDFRKTLTRARVRATQKALDSQHAQTFTAEAVDALKAEALAFYAAKRREEAA